MSTQLRWVFLDLDNTLWDFDGNAEEALKVLYERHQLHLHSTYKVDQFIHLYKDVNHAYWSKYEKGEVDKETLRTKRFTDTFDLMGVPHALQPENVWQEYLDICPQMTRLMPHAQECLASLSQKFSIGLLTNGFEETQQTKLKCSGLGQWVDFMQTSESVGLAKPDPKFFQLALDTVNCEIQQAVYIGDNLKTDVCGGVGFGLDTYFYNPNQLPVSPADLPNSTHYKGEVIDLLKWAMQLLQVTE